MDHFMTVTRNQYLLASSLKSALDAEQKLWANARTLTEPECADRVREPAHDLIQDQFRKLSRLRQEVYGPSYRI
jgi:hypothetical protein